MADETKKDSTYRPFSFSELIGSPLPGYKPLSFEKLIEARQVVADNPLNLVPAPSMEATIGSNNSTGIRCLRLKDSRAPFYFVLDDFTGEGHAEKMRLSGRVQEVIDSYEKATTPQQRYKAQSELCRLVDRISGGAGGVAQGIQSEDNRYFTRIKRDGENRIPELQVVEAIGPAQLSKMELDFMFPDKSGSMPSPRTSEEKMIMRETAEIILAELFGFTYTSTQPYLGTLKKQCDERNEQCDGRNRGVKKE